MGYPQRCKRLYKLEGDLETKITLLLLETKTSSSQFFPPVLQLVSGGAGKNSASPTEAHWLLFLQQQHRDSFPARTVVRPRNLGSY